MVPIRIEGPAVEPVSASEMQAHLRLDDAAEEALLSSFVTTARHAVEAASGRLLVGQTWRIVRDAWPGWGFLDLPLSPALAVVAVRVLDASGTAAEVPAEAYRLDATRDPARLVLSGPLPAPGLAAEGIVIDVRFGFGEGAEAVPPALRQAIRLIAARWFEHRGDEAPVPLPAELGRLIAPFRPLRLA